MKSTPFKIASRYLFSKKTKNVINLISGISLVVVACVTATMIILLSAFNGIEDLVDGLYNKFDPDITIFKAEGKVLYDDSLDLSSIYKIEGVQYVTSVLEEAAILAKGNDRKALCELIGVDTSFVAMAQLENDLVSGGEFSLHDAGENYVLPGIGIATELGLNRRGEAENVRVFAPKRGKKISRAREKAFLDELAITTGSFSINAELDLKYVVSTLDFARRVFNYEKQSSYIGVEVLDEDDSEKVRDLIKTLVSSDYVVKTRKEKNPLVYETNASEKRATFLILLFVLIIAVFNGMASLTMLVIEKKRDISVLQSMGASWTFIRKVFILEGVLINIIGVFAGLLLGLFVCWLQIKFSLIGPEGGVVDAYPIKIIWSDILGIMLTVISVGVVATYLMVHYLIGRIAKS